MEDADTSAFVLNLILIRAVACSVVGAELSPIRSIDPGRRVFSLRECEPGKVLMENNRFEFLHEFLINLMALQMLLNHGFGPANARFGCELYERQISIQ